MDNIFAIIGWLVYFAIIIVAIAGVWKTFEKAGQPGWGALIPFYNLYLMCKIAGKPGWWLILCFIPIVNIIAIIIITHNISLNFGKGVGYTLGLIFLSPIFYCLLGFGDAEYSPQY